MNRKQDINPDNDQTVFGQAISQKVARKLLGQHDSRHEVWSGLGMTGLVGWSVVVPTLLGTALGVWLDNHYPSTHSWTLTLLISGLALGCFNAWHWVSSESRAIGESSKDEGE